MNAVEERSGVELDGGGELAARNRIVKARDVAFDDSGIEAQFVRSGDAFVAERLSHDVQELVERASRAVGRALRPQQYEQPIARHPARPRGRQHGEKSEALPLIDRGRDVTLPAFYGEPAQCAKAETRPETLVAGLHGGALGGVSEISYSREGKISRS